MFCNNCGKSVPEEAKFCPNCSAAVGAGTAPRKQLIRPRGDRKVAGVCAGLARYFDLNVTTVRLIWLLLVLFGGIGVLAYLVLWIVMPSEG